MGKELWLSAIATCGNSKMCKVDLSDVTASMAQFGDIPSENIVA